MVRSFAGKRIAAVWADRIPNGFPSDLGTAFRRKLRQLAAARSLEELRNPPANRPDATTGGRTGQYSIPVNAQWRLCFAWRDGDAYDAEIVDNHRG
jgi:proteic killer suppression protein